jgi:hypothetical protein
MFYDKDPVCGIDEGLYSAIACLKIDEARKKE